MTEFDPRLTPEEVSLWVQGKLAGHDLEPPVFTDGTQAHYHGRRTGWKSECSKCNWGFSAGGRAGAGWQPCTGDHSGIKKPF